MKIGEVSAQLGIPASTIRYYERVGVLDRQPREGGRRIFGNESILLLRFVQLAQAAGFTIAEIKALLESHREEPGPAGMWKPFAEAKLQDVRSQIDDLQRTQAILSELLSCKCGTLNDCIRASLDANIVQE